MKHIYLVRHAKAEAPNPSLSDRDRALTLRGRTSAGQLAEGMASAGAAFEVAMVSPANRTVQTWKIMAAVFPDAAMQVIDVLYETDDEGVVAELAALPDDVSGVAVVGHEPTISATASLLAGPDSDSRSLKRVALGMPTGAAAVLEFDGAWVDLAARTATLTNVVTSDPLF